MKVVIGILILCVIVIVHEYGHFIIAKLNGIEVYEFTIGFGPKLVGFSRGGTNYVVRLIPFGGACVFENLDDMDSDEAMENSSYRKASVWSRIATTVAGPVFNFILAFVLGLFVMKYAYIPSAIITDVTEGQPAYEAGMRKGDVITRINGSRVYLYPEVSMAIQLGYGSPLEVTYERDGNKTTVNLIPEMNKEYGQYMIGVSFGGSEEPDDKGSLAIIADSYHYVRYMVKMTFASIRMLVGGQVGLDAMAGPVGVVSMVSSEYEAAQEVSTLAVVISMLNIALLLSANLGVVNLLPLPALDGGKLVLLIIEVIRGKALDVKKEGIVNFIGVLLLLILMVAVLYNDIAKLFR